MRQFFTANNSEKLIILFDGWGMDETPYKPLKSSCDILFLHNYSDLAFDFDFKKYEKIILIAFSAGVYIAALLQNKLPPLDYKVAINGTLQPLDKFNGIPADVLDEMSNLSLENALEFRKKIVSDEKHLALFNKNMPARDLESSINEINCLKIHFTKQVNFEYDKVLISRNDRIIPYENQIKAWEGHNNILETDAGHFPFYSFSSFDEIIDKNIFELKS